MKRPYLAIFNSKTGDPVSLSIDRTKITDKQQLVAAFNSDFSSIGQVTIDALSHDIDNLKVLDLRPTPTSHQKVYFKVVSRLNVFKTTDQLVNKSSQGLEEISNGSKRSPSDLYPIRL